MCGRFCQFGYAARLTWDDYWKGREVHAPTVSPIEQSPEEKRWAAYGRGFAPPAPPGVAPMLCNSSSLSDDGWAMAPSAAGLHREWDAERLPDVEICEYQAITSARAHREHSFEELRLRDATPRAAAAATAPFGNTLTALDVLRLHEEPDAEWPARTLRFASLVANRDRRHWAPEELRVNDYKYGRRPAKTSACETFPLPKDGTGQGQCGGATAKTQLLQKEMGERSPSAARGNVTTGGTCTALKESKNARRRRKKKLAKAAKLAAARS